MAQVRACDHRLGWGQATLSGGEVDSKREGIMSAVYKQGAFAAQEYGDAGNIQRGANIAGFLKVADAMLEQGVV